jgi:surfactin synthase thioesterase subunit
MTQDVDQLAERVAAYRAARAAAGLDPAAGSVVVLLHTYLAASEEQARADAFRPFCDYLRSSLALFGQATNSLGMNVELEHMSEEDLDYVLERAFTSYCDTRALIGTVDSCTPIAERVLAAGADELACFVDFGVSLPQLRGSLPRMVELRERVVRQAPGRTPASAARDERITRARGGDALLTLFCLPHAGGSAASLYHGWDAALDGVARVVPLELPGRGRRAGEPPYADLDAVLADCAKRIAAEIDGAGFALFGHSIGGLLAYELDATLRRDGARAPAALVLAATIPPNRAERHAQIHELRDEELLAAVAHLGGLPQAIVDHPEARAFHAAALRADYRLYEHHRLSDPPHRVAVPLLVLLGGDDPLAAPDDSARWRALAAAGLTTRVVPSGSHFFPHAQRDQTLAAVGGFLAGVREH